MKKYIYAVVILIIILITTIILMHFTKKDTERKCIDNVELEDIFYSINTSVDIPFKIVDSSSATTYIPLDFSKFDDYILASRQDNPEEFFLIIKNIDDSSLDYLKETIDLIKEKNSEEFKNSKVNNHNGITYASFSSNDNYIIEGIIRSYIYCE